MIRDTISDINERITEQLDTDAVQVEGMVVPFHSQQDNTTRLLIAGEGKQLVPDNKLLWQSAHLTDGNRVTDKETWGSFTDHIYDVRFVLIGLSKSRSGIDVAMRALDGVAHLVIDDTDDKTLSVLARYFQTKADQQKNYDPDVFAFAIRYHIEGVTDEDFAELPDESELALLPVIHPEPVPVDPPVIPPVGPSLPTSYVHVQGSPAPVWIVEHNLGSYPAGIVVFDSAGSRWEPDILYVNQNRLQLSFGTISFSGKAYIS